MQNKVILCVENNKSIKDIKLCNADVCDIFYFNENMSIEAIEQNLRKDENLNLIVYTSTRDRSYDVIKCLVGGGCCKKQILNFNLYIENPKYTPFFAFNLNKKYDGFIFGMSHARIDINETILKGKWYNFAFESMDMFYQRELLQRLIQKEEFTKNIIIEMPYYYFNYDISKTIETFKIRTRAFFELDEYHHYLESQEGKIWIDAYKKMLNIAGEISYLKASNASKIEYIKKFIRFYRRKNFKKVWNESEKVAISQKLDHVWSIYRNDTIKENIGIWKNIQKIIKKLNINLTILICPINPLFLEKNYIEISKMKDLFYNSIGNGSFRILDYSDKFDSEVYFSDYCHLNVGGNALFTKTLKLVL